MTRRFSFTRMLSCGALPFSPGDCTGSKLSDSEACLD